MSRDKRHLRTFLVGACLAAACHAESLKFDFGGGAAAPGYTQVASGTLYSKERGYGFEPGSKLGDVFRGGTDPLRDGYVAVDGSLFKFSVAVPEGNYRVTLVLGDADGPSLTTVRAESRRLMLERVRTEPGVFVAKSFLVNVRHDRLSPGNELKLDVRERDPVTREPASATWDEKLTLQFGDEKPRLCSLEIERVESAVTVFLIGDSTVTDQPSEPFGTWGQCLPRWFAEPVVVANHAESGQTLKAFRFQRRWDKVLSLLRPGDYVFMQFGHNDLNKSGHDAMWPRDDAAGDWINTYSEAETDYKWLLAAFAAEAKRRGGIPVVVSPMTKIDLKTGRINPAGLGAYPEAAREAAALSGAAFVDLNGLSVQAMQALGEAGARRAYVDGLHTNAYGGYLLSRCMLEGIRRAKLDLARHIVDDAGSFDPAHPAPGPEAFSLPVEPPVPLPLPPGMKPRRATAGSLAPSSKD